MFLTFGKYRNKSVKEVIDNDRQYSEWFITQHWFTIKHKDLHRESLYKRVHRDSLHRRFRGPRITKKHPRGEWEPASHGITKSGFGM